MALTHQLYTNDSESPSFLKLPFVYFSSYEASFEASHYDRNGIDYWHLEVLPQNVFCNRDS